MHTIRKMSPVYITYKNSDIAKRPPQICKLAITGYTLTLLDVMVADTDISDSSHLDHLTFVVVFNRVRVPSTSSELFSGMLNLLSKVWLMF